MPPQPSNNTTQLHLPKCSRGRSAVYYPLESLAPEFVLRSETYHALILRTDENQQIKMAPELRQPVLAGQLVEVHELISQAAEGNEAALAELFEAYRLRLRRMIALRLDARIQGRLDASDILQETFVVAAANLLKYSGNHELPFYFWLRLIAGEGLAKAHRSHLGAELRQVQKEVRVTFDAVPRVSTVNLASRLVGDVTTASEQLRRQEVQDQVRVILDRMDPHDGEVLALRHFEELTSREVAIVLQITESAATSRHRRALVPVTELLEESPELPDGFLSATPQRGDDD